MFCLGNKMDIAWENRSHQKDAKLRYFPDKYSTVEIQYYGDGEILTWN